VYAAVTIPRRVDGTIDESSLAKSLEFLVSRGIQGFALNGATGEYCLTSPEELQKILALAKGLMTGSRKFVCGIGSGSIRGSLDRGKIAMEAGAIAVLLPMPFFYPYAQDDLDTFCREVAGQLSIPILLYNLPQFTSALAPSTVRSLITECPNIIGIKDSSGNLDILRMLSHEGIDAA
jgi:4-hydroxy-tetrahydrodipicolinate synthase